MIYNDLSPAAVLPTPLFLVSAVFHLYTVLPTAVMWFLFFNVRKHGENIGRLRAMRSTFHVGGLQWHPKPVSMLPLHMRIVLVFPLLSKSTFYVLRRSRQFI